MEKILKSCWCFIILGLIWQGLELLLYGQIQHRVVDNIMGLLFFPFIYKSMGERKTMSKFDYMQFTGGSSDEFVVHAKKYTKEEAVNLAIVELALEGSPEPDNVYERWCRYYVRVPEWCGFDRGGDSGCYTYCGKDERGAFPVWVIEIN